MKKAEACDLMGREVEVHSILRRGYGNFNGHRLIRYWERLDLSRPFIGWVTMVSHVQDGAVYCDEGYHFEQSSRIECIKVTRSPFTNPEIVPLDGYTLVEDGT